MRDDARYLTVDWSNCPIVETNPNKVSGAPIIKGTRVQADAIVQNYEGGESVEDIADNFTVSPDEIRQLLAYANGRMTTRR